MKLLLIQAWNEKEHSYRGRFSNLLSYPSLTLAVLYSLIPDGVFEKIDIIDENSQKVNYDKEQYDLVLISFETSSSITAYKHCAEFKKRGSYIVCGGYHATALPEEVLKHCDTVIVGPAEKALPQFVQDYIDHVPEKIYRDYEVCAADFRMPARDKITKRKKLKIPAITADRGCNNCCKYCSMRTMWKSNPRPVEDVIAELSSLKSRMVIFYDPNFFAKRDYAIELMRAMRPLKILWASNATADFGYDHELMDEAYKSGCRGVLIGLESFNSQSLTNAAKRFHNADKYREIIENIHSHGLAVNGCFVLGFDSDTEEQLLQLPERVEQLGLDLCRFAVLTPYPGTRMFEEYKMQNRIITEEWNRYTQNDAVFMPKNMSPERLNEIYRQVWKESYTWKRIFKRIRKSPWRYKHFFLLLGANIGFKFLGINKEN